MRSKALGALLVGLLASGALEASPYKPVRDDEVLLTLPGAAEPRRQAELARLERAHLADPRDPELAEKLAREYVAMGRRDGDPRFYGMARAALLPWDVEADVPVGIVELRAEIRGFTHDFAGALRDYDQVLARDPGRTSARLARATLHTVTGDFAKADEDCAELKSAMPESRECKLVVALAKGDPAGAWALCEPDSADAWMLELVAEAAALANRFDQAEQYFVASLAKEDRVFTRIAFADFLLRRGRAGDALRVLPGDSRNLGVMVRRAAALTLSDPRNAELTDLRQTLEDTFALERERGDDVHGRELALYLLNVKKDPRAALPVARANYEKQKERIDASLLQEAEAAAK